VISTQHITTATQLDVSLPNPAPILPETLAANAVEGTGHDSMDVIGADAGGSDDEEPGNGG
jgi:hypothetical protein